MGPSSLAKMIGVVSAEIAKLDNCQVSLRLSPRYDRYYLYSVWLLLLQAKEVRSCFSIPRP